MARATRDEECNIIDRERAIIDIHVHKFTTIVSAGIAIALPPWPSPCPIIPPGPSVFFQKRPHVSFLFTSSSCAASNLHGWPRSS